MEYSIDFATTWTIYAIEKPTNYLNLSLVKNILKLQIFKKNGEYIAGTLQMWIRCMFNTSDPYKGIMPRPNQIEALFSNLGP